MPNLVSKEVSEGLKDIYHADSNVTGNIAKILLKAVQAGASDIFLSSGSPPSCQIDGRTVFMEGEEVIRTEKLLEVLSDYDQKKLLENLGQDFGLSIEGGYRFRANAFLQRNGVSIAFRAIPSQIPSFEERGLPEQLKKIVDMDSGLVIVTGSTGSGKSSTLATIVDLINEKYQKHIITIEDPIEFIHNNKKSLIEQREIGLHAKSFDRALRSALREAPDVILVGELRDLETTALALTAAETGSLVLATLHANSAPSAVTRIIDIFPNIQQNQIRSQLAQSLQAIIWQTLLPNKSGKGRSCVFEVMFQNYAVSTMIRDNKVYQLKSVIETGKKSGMIPLKDCLEDLIRQDKIEVAVAQNILNTHVS
ncbi:PilT/PilU family type 4a pilus ATPase [Candidatus Gracilibacteria bacterium]|nr:PilT/PilU family type 4a pilus ATPase [Candidatus Gracilibacteria bacterium]